MTLRKYRTYLICVAVIVGVAAVLACCNKAAAATNTGIMPPPYVPRTNRVMAAPVPLQFVTLVWSNSLPYATGWSNNTTYSVWSNAPLPQVHGTSELWYSNGIVVKTNTGTNWFYYGGGSICFTNPHYDYRPVTTYMDLAAVSNSLVTGLATITNLAYPTNGVLRESHPFALSNRVTLRMNSNEMIRAFYGPKSK